VTSPDDLVETLRRQRLLAIVRHSRPEAALHSVLALAGAGIRLIEVSLTTPEALPVLSRARSQLDPSVMLGAGTVIERAHTRSAAAAGAAFVVSPGLGPGAVEAIRLGVPCLTGAFTPTEVIAARQAGSAAIKLFPAGSLGPAYLRALREPFPDTAFVAVGGVGAENAADFLRAGSVALGVGSALVGDAEPSTLRRRVGELRKAVESVEGSEGVGASERP
jgi:2-dehydro-3-deoxyphosphogluconate aldolase / (4S)-4-hydroxy-2-oxoglutarate aldolase